MTSDTADVAQMYDARAKEYRDYAEILREAVLRAFDRQHERDG